MNALCISIQLINPSYRFLATLDLLHFQLIESGGQTRFFQSEQSALIMKKKWQFLLFLLTSEILFAKNLPNVILIYGDDVGYGDVGAYGSTMIPTPNIDRLASEGLLFTDGHCSASTCTPSRFSMLTGIHAFRHKVNILPPDAPMVIPTNKLTLPGLFKKAGYFTAFIGKWHLGVGMKGIKNDWNGELKPGPMEVGFDLSFSLPYTNDRVPCVYVEGHRVLNLDPQDPIHLGADFNDLQNFEGTMYPDAIKNPEAMTYYKSSHWHNNSVIHGIGRIGYMRGGKSALWKDQTMTDEFVQRIKKVIQEKREEPFFIYYPSQNIHVPRAPHPRFIGKSSLGLRGDAMVEFDWAVGEIMNTLEENGLSENTMIVFSSDNGPVYDDGYEDGTTVLKSSNEIDRGHDGSGIWRGGKYQIYEGGSRVPFIVRWPDRVQPGISKAVVSQIDFVASFAELLGIDLSHEEAPDSRNYLGALLGEEANGSPYLLKQAVNEISFREGPWKYIAPLPGKIKKGKPVELQLYNLSNDPSEKKNVLQKYPEVVESMQKKWIQLKAKNVNLRLLNL